MKKQFLLPLFVFAASLSLDAQQQQCATMDVHAQHLQNPQLAASFATASAQAKQWLAAHPEMLQRNGSNRTSAPLLTIPTVVHVLYKTAQQNITDNQVYSQIAILNQDYRRLNADTVNTPAIFDTIAADIEVEFCLASVDPDGNPTNGITRTSTTGGQLFGFFSPFEDAKYDSLGGKNAWPTDRYLNIWVCELFPGLLGYAQFPGGAAATDGVVITYTAFGNMGTVTAPSLLGRTTVHEVGHWMGLYHIWGDDQDCTTGSDSIADTPNANSASASDCNVTLNSCSNEDPWWGVIDPPDMVQNYMDYSHDSCMNMFSLGQKARMHSFLYGDARRFALFTSNGGCNPLSINKPQFEKYFSVYPNPTADVVNVSYFGSWNAAMQVSLVDHLGRTLRAWNTNSYQFTLDLQDFPAGLYFLRMQGEGGVAMKRIVVQH